MRLRGDIILTAVALFRASDPAERKRLAQRISELALEAATMARGVTERHALSPVDAHVLSTAGREIPLADLTDEALDTFNSLLPWAAMTTDASGRTVGAAWSEIKRSRLNALVDERITQFDRIFPLSSRHVLEVGCFEGIHTIGCLTKGARVTAVDVRLENVIKTLARLWAYGFTADVRVWDLEAGKPPATVPKRWDVLHHIGVLYHLANPAEHLAIALDRTAEALILDTHVAEDLDDAKASYDACGRQFRYARKAEKPISPFAGVTDHAKWLLLEDLEWICRDRGFTDIRVQNLRAERNGRRVLLWAFRPEAAPPM